MTRNLILLVLFILPATHSVEIDPKQTRVWGPGLDPEITLPVRYFFLRFADKNGKLVPLPSPDKLEIHITGNNAQGPCLYGLTKIPREDGSIIVRYRLLDSCQDMRLIMKYNGVSVAESPYDFNGFIDPASCYCPREHWLSHCPSHKLDLQIESDLRPFEQINFTAIRDELIREFDSPGAISLCHYVVRSNRVFRRCYGKYTGFKVFWDKILLALARMWPLPDVEFFANLGDWPLAHKRRDQRFPIFSWCGDDKSFDIVLPTYDIAESSVDMMTRVALDLLSVQRATVPWTEKHEKVFWRGRDACRARIDLIDIARRHPDLFNASITNFFFFKDEAQRLGPTEPRIPFPDFFDYKYQLNIDGTVAAYRFPYLLAGDSVVLKQASPFYEHFYRLLTPGEHYIPVKRDLSDLVEKVRWAKENDAEARRIARNARRFVEANLLPHHILCYHARLLREFANRLVSEVKVLPDMEEATQPEDAHRTACECRRSNELPFTYHDEL